MGRDTNVQNTVELAMDFNSHARVGRDPVVYRVLQFVIISTHTPAWGVTAYNVRRHLHCGNFNSHARVGRDAYQDETLLTYIDFNSHARVGRDFCDFLYLQFVFHFNSHARVGRDEKNRFLKCAISISTHTPAWGVTEQKVNKHNNLIISTHTPAWGVTLDVVSKRHNIITRADYPMQNHTISHKIFLFYFFPLRSAPEF